MTKNTTDAASAYGGYDPLELPSARAASIDRNTKVAEANQDARTAVITRESTANIAAARAQVPTARPPLTANGLTGSGKDVWEAIRHREVGAFNRVRSRLEPAPVVGRSTTSIIEAALDAGRKREAIPEDLAEQLAALEHRDELAKASHTAVHRAGAIVAQRLTTAARENRGELTKAVQADLRALVADAGQVARALEGVTSAEMAIRLGQRAVVAWGARDGLRQRMVHVAKDLHYIRRATKDGFTFVSGRSPDALAQTGLETTFSSTWDVVDGLLEKLKTPDSTVDLLVGR